MKNKMPVVESFENVRDLEAKILGWNVPIALYAEVEDLQSYAEKVTKENKRLNLMLVAQSKDIVTGRKVKEERDRAVGLLEVINNICIKREGIHANIAVALYVIEENLKKYFQSLKEQD